MDDVLLQEKRDNLKSRFARMQKLNTMHGVNLTDMNGPVRLAWELAQESGRLLDALDAQQAEVERLTEALDLQRKLTQDGYDLLKIDQSTINILMAETDRSKGSVYDIARGALNALERADDLNHPLQRFVDSCKETFLEGRDPGRTANAIRHALMDLSPEFAKEFAKAYEDGRIL
ncbi:hypothetical protein LCGC14_0163970 [marine sediment metagenome]|uniref:Uncharacterized protein n=1 Tax=marine sediment metagenome TaxID=412755 RepID=A0A0F9XWH4_9ZZZZ